MKSFNYLRFFVSFAFFVSVASWVCIPIASKTIQDGVVWNTQNCTKDESVSPPLLVINSIHVDVARNDLRVVPAMADPIAQVQNLPDMATQDDNFIAGINGGYFWRVDIDGFWRDNVCKGKLRSEAEQPASSENVNYGISDGSLIIDGKVLGNNCNCTGYSRPAVLSLDGVSSEIQVLHRGENVDASQVRNAIGAGPNLVSLNTETGKGYIDIPADDDNINRLVYEATTAVGLVQSVESGQDKPHTSSLVLVTSDGSDSCMPKDKYCGILSPDLASLMLEVFNCTQAMSMDQGGSTTMWIRGENPERNGVVSRSDNTQAEETEGVRALANGLFIQKR